MRASRRVMSGTDVTGLSSIRARVRRMRADHHELPTPRTTLRTGYVRVLVWCKSCRHRRDADLQGLVDAGQGDVPLIHLRFRCSNCAQPPHGFSW